MKPTETVVLTEYVQDCCPQQHIGEYTADAWYDLLGDLELADCKLAVQAVAKRQPFVSPSEIRAEVRRIRAERIERSVVEAPPPELLDDPRAYQQALQASVRRAADGLAPPAERAALPPGEAPSAIRESRPPASLRAAFADFRRRHGMGRPRRAITSGPDLALEQAGESRRRRADEEAREAAAAQQGREAQGGLEAS